MQCNFLLNILNTGGDYMFYKMLSSGQLKVVLSARDMAEFGVSIDSDSLNSPDVRIVF